MKKLSLIFILIFNTTIFSQWFVQYTSNPSQSIYCLKFWDVNTGYHSGVLYNSSTYNIYKTTNGGLNYVAQNSYHTAQRFMSIFIIHPDTVLICGNYGKIMRTYNGGNNWVLLYSDTVKQFWGMQFVNSNTGFIAGSHGTIMKTTNKGDNWIILNSTTQTALDGIWFVNENVGYVGGANVFLKTTDAGNSWTNVFGSFISPFETATAVWFANVNYGLYCTNAGRIVMTTNGGINWNLVYSMNGGIWGMSFTDSLTGYACTSTGKVLKTFNGGYNWGEQNTPLSENLYEIHFPSAQTGYIASWSGKILKTTNGGLTYITKSQSEIPNNYSLEQNYPNPFNSSTKIKFSIPENKFISLKVFDITGKLVATLINSNIEKGTYELTFNADFLASGIYFYTLSSGSFTITREMVLIK